ncbi:MAG: hypothetical protein AWU54_1200 [Candidatus Frackibacter sp. T328-2]|nr:MAG: hypothetical protein AWU54_1200 [Candidatus Frackibacter sp. T328-2]
MISHLYNMQFEVYRNNNTKDEYNRISGDLVKVESGKGRISKEKLRSRSGNPESEEIIDFKLFTDPDKDIMTNDLIDFDGHKYKAEPPMRYSTHMEVLLKRTDEV